MLKHIISALAFAGLASLALPHGANAASVATVCASGCTYSTIQAAVDGVNPGDTVLVRKGTYTENVTISKPLTLSGEKQNKVVIYPALSNPACSGGSLCGGSASNIILVQANNVTIEQLTLDGDNPALTSGVVRGGADIEARNGIITNHLSGKFDALDVHDVTVKNIFLRGMYASSGGTFNFQDDVVQNVQGDPSSIGMFNHGGAGTFSRNFVSYTNDAISSNYSTGVQFLNNVVTESSSGIHTDNAGANGGSADVIKGNVVSACTVDGYGVWVFVPYIAPTVYGNTVRGCNTGLAIFGGAGSGDTHFVGNRVDGSKALSSPGNPVLGALITTDQVGFDCGNVNATFTGNAVHNNTTGFELVPGPLFGGSCTPGSTISAKINYNAIFHNGTGLHNGSTSAVDARYNWWGCSDGPSSPRCNPVTNTGGGSVNYTPWLSSNDGEGNNNN